MARRLLFVSQQLPWPKDSGGNIRTHAMLAALARDFEVVLCSTSDGSPAARQGVAELEARGIDVRLAPDTKQHSGGGQVAGVLRSLVRGVPAVLVHNENPALGALVQTALREGVDHLHLNHIDTAPYVDLAAAPPAVLDTHNLLYEYYARRAEVESSAARRWVCRREARLLRRHEPELFRRLRTAVVCSETERASLARLDAAVQVAVVPNGVDCAAFQPSAASPPEGSQDLVFVGDLGYGPNQDAALRFVEEVLPLVRAAEPRARFLAVGKNPPSELVQLGEAREDLVVTGFVDEVTPWIHRARVYVVPIRYGSGTRLKVLEAFAFGMPTVSTTIGAEGIDYADGEDLLIRDEPADMAEAIVGLLRDSQGAARLGSAARAKAEALYDWPSLGERMVAVHRALG